MNERCLLLNSDYTMIKVLPWEVALKLVYSDKVYVVENYDRFLNHPTVRIQVPAVVALKKYCRMFDFVRVKFNSDTVYSRDKYTCAYCGKVYPRLELTKDHIIPRAHFRAGKASGKETSWDNIITSCKKCNNRKGGRTPEEAGMKLLFGPSEPKSTPKILTSVSTPKEWIPYLDNQAG